MIYVIPLRLDECNPSFEYLKRLHWVDYFTLTAHEKLLKSLHIRANALKIKVVENKVEQISGTITAAHQDDEFDLYRFITMMPRKNSKISYPFSIGKYPVTNMQYERFLLSSDFDNPAYWSNFPKFDENGKRIIDWGSEVLGWLWKGSKKIKTQASLPHYWDNKTLGKSKLNHPVVGISWYQASAYCKWLFQNWSSLVESKANLSSQPLSIRLPLEFEWVTAAGGDEPTGRYPWDEQGKETISLEEILQRTNVNESRKHCTTPVNAYALGKSPHGVMDMAGNVWEWQANYSGDKYEGHKSLSLRGGSWGQHQGYARSSVSSSLHPDSWLEFIGFRVVVLL
jgi:formylglycine-generating enzyme required for sulfatase activity